MADNTIGHGRPKIYITPSDLGRRISARRILGHTEGRPVFGDVIGVLTSWDGGVLTVLNRAGEAVTIMEEALVAGKAVPPAPIRRTAPAPEDPGAVAMQRIAARGWPAVEAEPLGEWVLRASSGFTRRGNSAQTLGDPGMPLGAALDLVQEWYARRGLAAHVELTTPGSPEGLAELLAERGATEAETLVRTAPLAVLAGSTAEPSQVRLSRRADAAWMSRYRRVGGDPALERAARQVLHLSGERPPVPPSAGGPSVWFATLDVPGQEGPAAIGRCVIDGEWAGFGAIEVVPELRRRGLASELMAVLASRAAEEGARGAYLQVEAENSRAAALYDKLGFTTSYRYHYARLERVEA
ncbi:GNAT family N-acetyltransferase [Streptacidiphilus sp. EB103A]|uniref:GNAT family N-acetyltransferase n=1 Tax=Streptacidiphilus sp. EB103A TaxID=3156275 RepID=UPI0035129C7A